MLIPRPYEAAVVLFLLLLSSGCSGSNDDDDEESEDVSPAIAGCIPIYTSSNTLMENVPLHPRLLASEIRRAQITICCANQPPCCSYFSLHRIYDLRIFFWSMEKTTASSWLLGFTSNSCYSIDKMVRYKLAKQLFY